MPDKKIIVVAGATGAQGGGLVQAILNDKSGEFEVRAITRDINSEKAKSLAVAGANVVQADVDDVDSLKKAFDGAYGAYCVTFFWNHLSPERESQQARNLADAAKDTHTKHVIWSTLEDTRNWVPLSDNRMPTLMGKYKVPHFDAKGETDSYYINLDLPVTILRTAFYWDNFIYFGLGPQKNADGKYAITFPMGNKKLPGIAAEDIGKCAFGIFKSGSEFKGKTIGISGGFLTGEQMANSLSKALGIGVIYQEVPADVYRGFGFPGADEMGNMFQVKRDFEKEYCGNRDLELSKKLNPELLTFDAWLAKYAKMIPLPK